MRPTHLFDCLLRDCGLAKVGKGSLALHVGWKNRQRKHSRRVYTIQQAYPCHTITQSFDPCTGPDVTIRREELRENGGVNLLAFSLLRVAS